MSRAVLVVFVDALGPEQLGWMGDALDVAPHRGTLDGILGYSCGALPTILTGTRPSTHGRMCLFAEGTSDRSVLTPLRWIGLLPRIVHERAAFRRHLGRALALAKGLTGYVALQRVPPHIFSWADLPEQEDLFAADRIGGATTFLAEARGAALNVHAARWQDPEERRWTSSIDALRRGVDLGFLYATELDGVLHTEGNDSARARSVARKIAVRVGEAQRALARDGRDVLTLVVGDHGMADVTRTIDPGPVTRALSARVFVDSTMLRVWGSDCDLARARTLTGRAGWPGEWLSGEDLAQRDAPVGDRFGRAIFVLREGTLFSPSYVGGAVRGMHGYDIGSPSTRAAIASSHPIGDGARHLADIANVVRGALGLPTAA